MHLKCIFIVVCPNLLCNALLHNVCILTKGLKRFLSDEKSCKKLKFVPFLR